MEPAYIENVDGRQTNALLHATASAVFSAEHGKKEALLGMQGRELSISQMNDSETPPADALFARIDRHNNEQGSGYGGSDLGTYLKNINLMWLTTPKGERIDSATQLRVQRYPDDEMIDQLVNELKFQSPLRTTTKNNL